MHGGGRGVSKCMEGAGEFQSAWRGPGSFKVHGEGGGEFQSAWRGGGVSKCMEGEFQSAWRFACA